MNLDVYLWRIMADWWPLVLVSLIVGSIILREETK